MTPLEAQMCVLTGRGTDTKGRIVLNAIPLEERADIINWLNTQVDYSILEKDEPITVDDAFYDADLTEAESGKIDLMQALIILDEMQKLIKAEYREIIEGVKA